MSDGPWDSTEGNITKDPTIWRRTEFKTNWNSDHARWDIPSFVDVHRDGRVVVAANYLRNDNGNALGGIPMGFWVECWFMRNGQRFAGPFNFGLGVYRFGDGKDLVARQYGSPFLMQYIEAATSLSVYRHVNEDPDAAYDHGGVDVNFPPIDFP